MYTISKDVEVIPTFDAMGLNPDLLRGIYAYGRSLIVIPTPIGFEKPSAIQQRAILPIIKGRDVIAQSQSGTGKTGVFSIGVLQNIDPTLMETQALILSPTRELAEQTQKVLLSIGDYMKVQCHACVAEEFEGRHPPSGLRSAGGFRNARTCLRHDQPSSPSHAEHQDAGDRRGRRDAEPGLQGAAVRHLPLPASKHAGGAAVGDDAEGGAGHDEQVHERAGEDSGEAR